MQQATGLRNRLAIGVVIGAIAALPLGAFGAKAFLAREPSLILPTSANSNTNASNNPFLTEGFDFTMLRTSDWRGPDIGGKIDLARLKRKDGKPLADFVGNQPIVVVSVSPDCAMCAATRDEMIHLAKKFSSMKLKYYLVSFAAKPPSDFFTYSDSLNVGVDAFLWDAEKGRAPEKLFFMTNPSNLLLSSDGTVIRVWPGSHADKSVRQRMARQILSDAAVIMDTLSAVAPQADHPDNVQRR
jgi:hypothetical protein